MSGPKSLGKWSCYEKKWYPCLGTCGKMLWTDKGHRFCAKCRKKALAARTPPRMVGTHQPDPRDCLMGRRRGELG